MKCPRCQQDNPSHAKFCLDCGASFKRTHESGPPVAPYTDLQHALSEALEQQTATSEILRIISRSPTNLQPVLDAIATNAALVCHAYDVVVFLREGDRLRYAAHYGPIKITLQHATLSRGSVTEAAILDRQPVHVHDLLATEPPAFPLTAKAAREGGFRAVLSVPLLRENEAIGALAIRRREVQPFTDQQIELLKTFADQAVIAIENVRLFNELGARNAELTDSLARQTATGEVLRAISRAQTDATPVFDVIAANAMRLCGGGYAGVGLFDGALQHIVAVHNVAADLGEQLRRAYPRPADETSASGRSIVTCATVQIPDLLDDPSYALKAELHAMGFRSLLAVPLLRDGQAIGSISVGRSQVGLFPEAQVALMRTFAEQAVIAIENVRLFKELQERNREVEQKSRELAAASQHKSEFLANMSHELRTPLNAIIGYSELLEEEAGDLDAGRLVPDLQKIAAAAQHQLSLINDILDLSKIEAGRMELELTEFDLPSAIDDALLLMRERASRRSLTLERTVDEGLGEIRADQRKVKQVLLNLLSNAVKFTPERGRIDLRTTLVDGTVEISVTDTGSGIAPEDQEAVFEEFRQVGTADKKVEGTGLGLTLCRKFVELHGGRIWVKSTLGVGSTFTFTIPLRHGE